MIYFNPPPHSFACKVGDDNVLQDPMVDFWRKHTAIWRMPLTLVAGVVCATGEVFIDIGLIGKINLTAMAS